MSKTENTENSATPLVNGAQISARALSNLVDLLDEERCRNWLFDVIRPGELGTVCPICAAPISERRLKAYRNLKKTKCPSCGRQYHASTNTIFHRINLSPQELVLMAALIRAGAKTSVIASATRRSEDTARAWMSKLNGKVQNV